MKAILAIAFASTLTLAGASGAAAAKSASLPGP